MADWSSVKSQALKILGDKAEVPDLAAPVTKAVEAVDKAWEAYTKAREEIESKLLDMDNSTAGVINALQQFRAKIEKDSFKLDPKKDGKKIDQAHKILLGSLDESIQALKRDDKVIDEITRHLAQGSKYKQSVLPL